MRGCFQGGMRGCSGGHVWLLGGVCGCSRGACVVAPGGCMVALGGVRGCSRGMVARGGGCSGRVCMVAPGGLLPGGVHGFFDEIRSMSGWYASYWNAFFLGYVSVNRTMV